jgi:hypothetical protein
MRRKKKRLIKYRKRKAPSLTTIINSGMDNEQKAKAVLHLAECGDIHAIKYIFEQLD